MYQRRSKAHTEAQTCDPDSSERGCMVLFVAVSEASLVFDQSLFLRNIEYKAHIRYSNNSHVKRIIAETNQEKLNKTRGGLRACSTLILAHSINATTFGRLFFRK